MHYRELWLMVLAATLVTLAGCGGSGQALAPTPGPPGGGGGSAQTLEIGPMLIRPASTAGFTAESLPGGGECAFVALHGSQVNYLASQALLDRIVFDSHRDGTWDIWVCNLDGSNLT